VIGDATIYNVAIQLLNVYPKMETEPSINLSREADSIHSNINTTISQYDVTVYKSPHLFENIGSDWHIITKAVANTANSMTTAYFFSLLRVLKIMYFLFNSSELNSIL
jgi:hypothetical protein